MFFVADLFIHKGRPVTFDGPTHIANMAQVYAGLKDFDFPVRWGAGFARYGFPAPLFAQQTTSYIGALINFLTQNIITSYNITVFLGVFFSTYLFYFFLRKYVGFWSALSGAFLFTFAPYRIINVYVRGALPEFYASIPIIMILISLHIFLKEKKLYGLILLSLSTALLLLTHPFMMVVGSFVFIPYGLYLILQDKTNIKKNIFLVVMSLCLGLGISAYFILPIFIEVNYLYYSRAVSHFSPGHFLNIKRFIFESWPYFTENDIGPRGHFHQGGFIEGLILILSIFYSIYQTFVKKKFDLFFNIFILIAVVFILMMLPFSEILYQKIFLFNNIQHPWRMFTGYIIIPPILLALLMEKIRYKKILFFILIIAVSILRFPQLYGKNYINDPQKVYFQTDDNMHGVVMNTVWMGEVRDYPYQDKKIQTVGEAAKITNEKIRNSSRSYTVESLNGTKVIDYTFYFPGWKAYVDSQETPIQFQDPTYRGIITFEVGAGSHQIQEKFVRTKSRILGEVASLISITTITALVIFRKKIKNKLTLK